MNHVLAPFLRKEHLVFIDDILIYSPSFEQHLQLVHKVFELLHNHQLKIKLSKCKFVQTKMDFLEHTISIEGVVTDECKIEIIKNWKTPSNVKKVHSFLGMAGYYHKFVKNFGIISYSLMDLLKKGVVFQWTSTTKAAFQALKLALITAPVLALPNFQEQFVVETDACDRGIGAVLL